MRKQTHKAHYENGLISDLRDNAAEVDSHLKKRALAESKKAKVKKNSVFSKLSHAEVKKLLSF